MESISGYDKQAQDEYTRLNNEPYKEYAETLGQASPGVDILTQPPERDHHKFSNRETVVMARLLLHRTIYKLTLQNSDLSYFQVKLLSLVLESHPYLRILELTNCKLGDEEARALAGMLMKNTTIEFLNLTRNNVGDDGATALGKALEMNKTLKKVWLMKNPIGGAGAADLFSSLVKNNTLKKFRVGINSLTPRAALAWDTLGQKGSIGEMVMAQHSPDHRILKGAKSVRPGWWQRWNQRLHEHFPELGKTNPMDERLPCT